MDHERYVSEWLERARATGFLPFEVAHPEPTETSLSGLGGRSDGNLHCGITHRIDGDEVFVETTVGDDPGQDDDSCIRHAVLVAVHSRLEGELTLPFTLQLRFEEQTVEIPVDGVPVRFWGVMVEGQDEWRLRAFIDARTAIDISGRVGTNPPIAIRRRHDLDIIGLMES